jgi:hypothetical protein
VLSELAREHQAHGGLDLAAGKGRLLGVGSELASLASEASEDVVDERVHDGHALLRDAGVRVHLLEHLVDVRRVRLSALLLAAFASSFLWCLSGLLGWGLGHGYGLLQTNEVVRVGGLEEFEQVGIRIHFLLRLAPLSF